MNKYWDELYKKKRNNFSLALDRSIQRNKYFYQYLKGKIANKVILDFGCGDSRQVFSFLDPEYERFRYIGFDYSRPSLELVPSTKNINFIQFDVNAIPIRDSSADLVFVFGLLMYCSNYSEIINRIIDLLKPGCELFLYESIKRENKPAKNSFVDLNIFKEIIQKKAVILFEKKDYSPVRYILVSVAIKLKIINNKTIFRVIIFIDAIIIKTFGKIINFLDGRAVFIKIKKNG